MVEDVFGILGTTLAGTFHIEEVVAEGGFGVVYRAEHVAFRAPVALKCLKIPGTISPSQSEEFVEQFREEAEILFHLSAQIPEVVRPLHADAMTLDDGIFVPYIAMEWVEGKPLDSIVIMREDDGLPPLKLRTVLKMLTPIAHALSKAHCFQVPGGAIVSVTHCDLKPENILITERDSPVRAKVLDFGIAKARDMMRQNVGRITDSEESRPFTPSYGAPEQWVPKRYGQTGPWTDVWGLALTMVECLTGRPPIDGDMHAMMGTCLDKSRRPTPASEGIDIGRDAELVFVKAMSVDPRDRYNDIESFWTAAERAASLPSSFERVRKRRDRPTYDAYEDETAPELGPHSATEFDLEMEEAGPGAPTAPPSAPRLAPDLDMPPSARGHIEGSDSPVSSRDGFTSSVDSDPFDDGFDSGLAYEPGFDPATSQPPSTSAGTEFKLEDSPVVPSQRPVQSSGSFDLDLDVGPPSVKPRAAVTTAALSRSGQHPALSRSGMHGDAMSRSGQFPGPASLNGPVAVGDKPQGGIRSQLRTPFILIGLGIVMTAVDMVLATTMGGTLSLGPVKLRYVAAGIAAIGMLMAFWNLLGDRDE